MYFALREISEARKVSTMIGIGSDTRRQKLFEKCVVGNEVEAREKDSG